MAPASYEPFVCRRCGACCREPGQVALTGGEAEAIAALLSVSVQDFTRDFTRLADNRAGLVLVEQPDGACIFLTADQLCAIEDVKPRQCRQFPLQWKPPALLAVCPGMTPTP